MLCRSRLQDFPCHTLDKGVCSCGDSACRNVAKHPLTAHGFKDASNDPATLDHFFTDEYEIANIALATGEQSNVSVIDVDDVNALASLTAQYGPFPQTWLAQTGSGGYHYYFRHDERWHGVKNAVKFAGGLDVRTTGGYVLLPPSLHKTGNAYRWIVAPDACELATAPAWLMALLPKHDSGNAANDHANETGNDHANETGNDHANEAANVNANEAANDHVAERRDYVCDSASQSSAFTIERASSLQERAVLYLASTPPAVSGQRGHDHTYSVVCRLCELFGELADDEILSALAAWNVRCSPPWSDKELRHKLASARKKVVTQKTPTTTIEAATNDDWPVLDSAAYYGIVGDLLRLLEPHTEADPAALLLTFLSAFSCVVGRRPYFPVEGTKHAANIFTLICGSSSRARKGTSLGRILDVLPQAVERKVSGLSSGEGLIFAVRDSEVETVDGKFVAHGGIDDKRLYVVESEFARTLKVMKREGNTLSALLRDAYDTGDIATLTKGNPLRASGVHLSITGHITREELGKTLEQAEAFNGFANRFLWALVKRSKLLPDGGGNVDLSPIRQRLADVIETAQTIERMNRDEACSALWRDVYEELVAEKTGLYDAVTSRGEAHTLRLSMLYALLDCSPTITTQHLQAALAAWRYCDDSARIIFGGVADDSSGSKLERRLKELVYTTPGIMRSELRHAISHKTTTGVFDAALSRLIARREIVCVPVYEERQAERYYPAVVKGDAGDKGDIGDVASPSPSPRPTPVSPTSPMSPVESATNAAATSPVSPTSPLPPTPNVPAATLAELLDWRNTNSAAFYRREDGSIWVTNDKTLTPALSAAIQAHQATLAVFVPADDPTPTTTPDDSHALSNEEFFAPLDAEAAAIRAKHGSDSVGDEVGRRIARFTVAE